jgi:uncharacterized membrane protein YfcA
MTPSILFGLAAAVLATSFISGIFGMAGGMILMGILLLFLSVPAAMVLHGVTQAASNGWRAILWRRYIHWGILVRHVAGAFLAVLLFSLVQFVPDRALVLVAMGIVPFLTMAVPERFAPRVDRPWGSELSGFVSGTLQLLSGVSGPMLDIFFVRTALDRRAVVATKAGCQLCSHVMKLVYFGAIVSSSVGEVGGFAMAMSVALALAGTTLSRAVLERLTDVQFRLWTQRIVMAIGAVYLIQGLAAYALA